MATTKSATKAKPNLKPKAKGKRPRCLQCKKELVPQFKDLSPGWNVKGKALLKWQKANPDWHQFTGHYGRYQDDRFCGQSCGYTYALKHTKPAKGTSPSKA